VNNSQASQPLPQQLYQIIGELFVARARLDAMYQELLSQVDEMAAEISRLRAELEKKNG
jgi:hypothetical protein